MKQLPLVLILLFFNEALSQTNDFSMGISYQTKSGDETYSSIIGVNFDIFQQDKMMYGLELGFNTVGINEDVNYTGTINPGQFSEDFRGEYVSNVFKFGGRVGKSFGEFNVIGGLGLNFLEEFQLRYDNLNILGKNGNYGVATGKRPIEGYYRIGVSYKIENFLPELGFGNNGVSVGLSMTL